jgi:DNA-binding GntR family transcriptional regulator
MKRPTLADSIVAKLSDDIVSKRLEPGLELDEGRIGERFGASRTPVREALRQLSAIGLVELKAHATPRIARVDEVRLQEMFDVMAELEALCALRAASAMSPSQRRSLERHHARMGETVRAGDIRQYRSDNITFHELISEGACNGYLREVTIATRTRLGPYRGAQLEAPARMAASYSEHEAILTAILRADGLRAAQLMRAHLATTRDAIDMIMRTANLHNN